MRNSISEINCILFGEDLKRHLKGLALIESIIMPDWEHRYFSFNKIWNVEKKEEMASMRDGCGNGYFIMFYPDGVIGKVILQEMNKNYSYMSCKIPNYFDSFKVEEAFITDKASFFSGEKKITPAGRSYHPLLQIIRF